MLDKIIKLWLELDMVGQIITLLFFIFLFFVLMTPYVKDAFDLINSAFRHISGWFERDQKISNNDEEIKNKLLNHRLLSEIKEIKIKLESLNFGDKYRDYIFKTILRSQVDSTLKCIKKTIQLDIDSMSDDEFRTTVSNMVIDIINESSEILIKKLGMEIYELVIMDPVKGMRAWTRNIDQMTWKLVDDVVTYAPLPKNHQKLYFVFTSINSSLSYVIQGIESRFRNINGDLSKMIEKNKDTLFNEIH